MSMCFKSKVTVLASVVVGSMAVPLTTVGGMFVCVG